MKPCNHGATRRAAHALNRYFLNTIGKGMPSRHAAEVFDEAGVVDARSRTTPGSQDIQLYEVVELAEHFGVSRLAALYRLRNLGLLTEPELNDFRRQEEAGRGHELAQLLALPEPDEVSAHDEFRHRFLGLALEAYRRAEITRAKLVELAQLVALAPGDVDELVRQAGLDDLDGPAEVLLPSG